MSASTMVLEAAPVRRSAVGGIRLRLKPAQRSRGHVQGAWWPRTDQLFTELPPLLAALPPQLSSVERVVYDETSWAPASLRMEFEGHSIILEGSGNTSTNTLSVIGEDFGTLVLLVVPPHTDPVLAYTAVMTASSADDMSTPDGLLGVGQDEAEERRLALLAQQRWESEGGSLRRRPDGLGERTPTAATETRIDDPPQHVSVISKTGR